MPYSKANYIVQNKKKEKTMQRNQFVAWLKNFFSKAAPGMGKAKKSSMPGGGGHKKTLAKGSLLW